MRSKKQGKVMPSEARSDVYLATQGRNSGDESVAFFFDSFLLGCNIGRNQV